MVFLSPSLLIIMPKRKRFLARGTRSCVEPRGVNRCSLQDTKEVDAQHLLHQLGERQVSLRLIPGIDPVHHAEQREGRHPEINALSTFSILEFPDKIHDDFYVAPLENQDLDLELSREGLVFVRHHLHLMHVVAKKTQMVFSKNANTSAHIHIRRRGALPTL